MAMRRAASRLRARLASVDPSRAWSAAPRALASVPCSLSRPREFSHKPEQSVYGGPKPASERVTLRKLAGKYRRGERISVVTAYDYPSAVHVRPLSLTFADFPVPVPRRASLRRPSERAPPRSSLAVTTGRAIPPARILTLPSPLHPLAPRFRRAGGPRRRGRVPGGRQRGDGGARTRHHPPDNPRRDDLPLPFRRARRVASPPRRRPPFRLVRKISVTSGGSGDADAQGGGHGRRQTRRRRPGASRRRQSRRRRRRGVHGPRRSHPAEHQRFGRIQTPGSNPRRSLGGGGARVGAGEGGMFRHRAGVRPRRRRGGGGRRCVCPPSA